MAALILPSRRVVQPQGPVEIDPGYGLSPIGLYLPSHGRLDAFNGKPFSGGSALTVRGGAAGMSAVQTAVNTGLYRALPDLESVTDYTAIWHGVPFGTPVGSTPAFVGVNRAPNSQGQGLVSIEYLNATTLQVVFLSGSTPSSRSGAFTWADTFGKLTTLIASYSADESLVRLRAAVGGVFYEIINSAVSSGAPPTLLGTEQFFVGPEVIEQPSRHPNAQTAFAGVFYGRLRDSAIPEIALNPWQLFRPIQRRIWVPVAGGGGPVIEATTATAAAGTSTAAATGAATKSATATAAAGSATVSAAGSAQKAATASAAGTATVSATASATAAASGTAAGVATVSATGEIAGSVSSATATAAAGAATVSATAAATHAASGQAAGAATVQASASARASATAAAAQGVATVAGVGSVAGTVAAASASPVAGVAAVSASAARIVGASAVAAAGVATASGIARAIAASEIVVAGGVATVSAVGSDAQGVPPLSQEDADFLLYRQTAQAIERGEIDGVSAAADNMFLRIGLRSRYRGM